MQTSANKALWREIRKHCRAILALSPEPLKENVYFLRLLGMAEFEMGDKRTAISTWKEAIAVEPDQWTYEHLGRAQAKIGQLRASWRTTGLMASLPDFDPAPYEPCRKRLQAISTALLLAGAAFAD